MSVHCWLTAKNGACAALVGVAPGCRSTLLLGMLRPIPFGVGVIHDCFVSSDASVAVTTQPTSCIGAGGIFPQISAEFARNFTCSSAGAAAGSNTPAYNRCAVGHLCQYCLPLSGAGTVPGMSSDAQWRSPLCLPYQELNPQELNPLNGCVQRAPVPTVSASQRVSCSDGGSVHVSYVCT